MLDEARSLPDDVAALFAATTDRGAALAAELKPEFGDLGGAYYTDDSQDCDVCRQAIRNKITLCRRNTNRNSNGNPPENTPGT
jgi:hypothetical protein